MNKFRSIFLSMAVAVALSACSTAPLQIDDPHSITEETIARLKANKATKEDLTRMFGEPEMVTPTEKGPAYFYKSLNLNSLWVTFNPDGTVDKIKWSE